MTKSWFPDVMSSRSPVSSRSLTTPSQLLWSSLTKPPTLSTQKSALHVPDQQHSKPTRPSRHLQISSVMTAWIDASIHGLQQDNLALCTELREVHDQMQSMMMQVYEQRARADRAEDRLTRAESDRASLRESLAHAESERARFEERDTQRVRMLHLCAEHSLRPVETGTSRRRHHPTVRRSQSPHQSRSSHHSPSPRANTPPLPAEPDMPSPEADPAPTSTQGVVAGKDLSGEESDMYM
ncbi:hypothetical protein D9619_011371 [Psilocybe cf. subviscida]|uniref:Uncharacterized protein n=1 Tax=Psilocybe cf. subviscida TaxID=2480587 RepID=A0A8H5BK87_9AGAR|nr:hypothetical protein D9619_011371 [Psilocybe cf. subviscida]